MTDTIKISRELAEQICVELEHDNDRYMLGRELRKALATPPADAADMGGQAGEEVEVVGYLDAHDCLWNETTHPDRMIPLMTVGQHQRIVAALSAQQSKPSTVTRDQIRDVFMRNGFTIKEGQTDLKPYVYAAAEELLSIARASWQRTQSAAVPECVERIRTLLPRFEAGVNWTGEDAAELAEAAYDAAELLTTKPAPAQDVAGLVEAAKKADDALSALVRNDQPLETLARKYGSDWSSAIDKVRTELVIQIAAHDKQSGGE